MNFRKLLNLLGNSKHLFRNFWNESPQGSIQITNTDYNSVLWGGSGVEKKDKKDKRIKKKPVEIFEEIINEQPKINLKDLDKQIELVEERIKTLRDHTRGIDFKQEEQALGYLRARKKYEKYKDNFKWAITNGDMIEKLCKKYKVRKVSIGNYYRNIPKEGVDEIKKFGESFSCVSRQDPLFELIIDDGGKEQKKDPILLAASPFGNWYYLLGAWDKEVEIVDDLIYKRK